MPSREELHKLIDSMPNGAIDAAHRVLSSLQKGPPSPPPDMAMMRSRLDERRFEVRKQMEERLQRRPGMVTGFGSSGNHNPATGCGSSSFSYWDDNGFVTQTYRQHLGHEMMIIERIRVENKQLVYKHEITGPGDKHDEREIIFDLAAN